MTPEEMKAFQAVFQEAADTLPRRLLGGRQLVWRPGAYKQMKSNVAGARRLLVDEFRKVRSGIGAPVVAKPGAWQAAKPSLPVRSGIAIGAQRAHTGTLGDLFSASSAHGVPADVLGALTEGAKSGYELGTLEPGKAAATGKLGFFPDMDPEQELTLKALASMLKSSGIFDPAHIGQMQGLAGEIAGCLPILGAVTNLQSGIRHAIKAASRAWDAHKLDKLAVQVTPGNPSAALGAVRTLYERKRTEFALIAAMDGGAGALQLTGLFVDLGGVSGPALGITKAALKLLHSILLSLRAVHEFRKANKALLSGHYADASILSTCPILGCYLISDAERSTLLAFLSSGPLPPDWMSLVADRGPEIETLIRLANQCQREAPFVLRGHENGSTNPPGLLKGEHYLDFRMRKGAARAAYEARLILQRDPHSLKFFARHLLSRIGL